MYVIFTDNAYPEPSEIQSEELDCLPSKGDIVQLHDGIFRRVIGGIWAYSKDGVMIVAIGTEVVYP